MLPTLDTLDMALQLLLTYTPFMNTLFGTEPLDAQGRQRRADEHEERPTDEHQERPSQS